MSLESGSFARLTMLDQSLLVRPQPVTLRSTSFFSELLELIMMPDVMQMKKPANPTAAIPKRYQK